MPAAHIAPLFALFAWIPIGLLFFYRYPARVAILITFIGGWAVLPTANFVPTDAEFPYWIMSASLPAGYFLTKATITGLTALAGVLLFDPRGLRRFRISAVWSAIGMAILVAIWAMAEYHNAGGWPTQGFSQSSGISGVWNIWIIYPLGAWLMILAAHAWAVYMDKPPSEDKMRREMQRQDDQRH